ncbi:ROK family protein [uncultured Polaribacter sp.]|uniref:ROK family protein n=1 Tax=uncultured Polaribacter sp. TaxID=174711 RepID=UPI002617CB66|nr:ROK family protein [uncultured Polaribacter sp.]
MKNEIKNDPRIVMTLDAGGTNFVFSAIQNNEQIIKPVRLHPNSDKLSKCLETITKGFETIKNGLTEKPSAISFAFPGPSDYLNGIIGNLQNLPSFRGGVALGPMLEHYFKIPVFINNDGNLFAYGEALFGNLPAINAALSEMKISRKHNNLIGITLGTGFGLGLVCNGQLVHGDNCNAGEAWLLRNVLNPEYHVEKHLSREGIRRNYAEKANLDICKVGSPLEIFKIGKGEKSGNRKAAITTFNDFGTVLGEALANIITLFDGIVILGGGVSAAYELFAPAMFQQMNSSFKLYNNSHLKRLVPKVYNLEDENERTLFLKGQQKEITIPKTDKKINYDPFLRTGVGVSKNSTSKSIALGAFAFAIHKLDDAKNKN